MSICLSVFVRRVSARPFECLIIRCLSVTIWMSAIPITSWKIAKYESWHYCQRLHLMSGLRDKWLKMWLMTRDIFNSVSWINEWIDKRRFFWGKTSNGSRGRSGMSVDFEWSKEYVRHSFETDRSLLTMPHVRVTWHINRGLRYHTALGRWSIQFQLLSHIDNQNNLSVRLRKTA